VTAVEEVEPEEAAPKRGITQKLLDGIETLGNKVPHPAVIFLILCGLIIVLSHVLYLFDTSVTYDVVEPAAVVVEEDYVGGSVVPNVPVPLEDYGDVPLEVHEETTEVESLLTGDGVRFLFTSFVSNFANFSVVAVVFVAMIGVGVAEEAGLMAALIRKLVKVSPKKALTFIIVFIGILSSVATDAGYLILIPLGAAAFLSVGRHPLAGLAAAFAGVGAGFGVNVLIAPIDGLLTEVTNESIQLVDPNGSIDLTANLYFSIAATFFLALVITVVTEKLIEPRLGTYEPEPVLTLDQGGSAGVGPNDAVPEADIDTKVESRGLRLALLGLLGTAAAITLLTVLPDAPLRNPETGAIVGDSPFMDSLIFIITLLFLVAGICYGIGAKTITGSVDVIAAITKTFAGLAGLVFLLLLISQFIAYFNFSNIPTVAAVQMADALENADIGAVWLLIGFVVVTAILDLIIPGVLPKWAIFAPVFIPLFMRLGVAPQTVLAAYRVGDSPPNVVTPLMVYLPFIVVVAQRYRKDSGIGTIVSLMIPYTVIVLIAWTAFFVIWYLLGIPLGPGYPVKI
jgi:aminobenzoyl-glutamate transport protein